MSSVLSLSAALLLASGGGDDFLLQKGDAAPPFSMRDLDRNNYSLADHTGAGAPTPKKAVLMSFFATWCEPCKKELPIVKEINERWKGKGVSVVYIGFTQGAKDLGPWAKESAVPWPVVPDTFGLLSRRYGASQLPHVVIIDGAGKVSFQHRGIAPDIQKTLETALAEATGEPIPAGEKPSVAASAAPAAAPAAPAAAPAAPAAAPAAASEAPRFVTKMLIGRTPHAEDAASHWDALAVYLGEAAEANMELVTEDSYEAFEKALEAGKYEIVNAGPLLCNAVKDEYEPIARVERQGTPTYLGIIFAKRGGKLKRLEQLKGKTVGLVSPQSTSGGLYPQKALIDAGLIPGKDVKVKWLGSHSKVAEAVKKGSVNAGGCYEDCRDAAWPDRKDKAVSTNVIGYTDEIPAEMILVKRSLAAAKKQALIAALLALNEQTSILQQMSQGELPITGISKATDKDLEPINATLELVKSKSKAR